MKRSSEKALHGYYLLLDLFEKLAKRFLEVERDPSTDEFVLRERSRQVQERHV